MSQGPPRFLDPMFRGPFAPVRAEIDLADCEVEGKLPADLAGTFYRVGPDFQYPPRIANIPFDGEGHVGMFRFARGRVDYKSRFVRTQRFKAQAEAREALFGTYRNRFTDEWDGRTGELQRFPMQAMHAMQEGVFHLGGDESTEGG